jgi:hypothetical protein
MITYKGIKGGTVETIVYDATTPLTWNTGAGTGTVNTAFPVTVSVDSIAGASEDQDANTTETIDLTNFDTMIIDVTYQISADGLGDSNIGDMEITVDGNQVFSFDIEADFSFRNDRFVLDISALSVSGIINIGIGANNRDVSNGTTTLTLNEMKLINRAI